MKETTIQLINEWGCANVSGFEKHDYVLKLIAEGYKLKSVPSASCGSLNVLTK